VPTLDDVEEEEKDLGLLGGLDSVLGPVRVVLRLHPLPAMRQEDAINTYDRGEAAAKSTERNTARDNVGTQVSEHPRMLQNNKNV